MASAILAIVDASVGDVMHSPPLTFIMTRGNLPTCLACHDTKPAKLLEAQNMATGNSWDSLGRVGQA